LYLEPKPINTLISRIIGSYIFGEAREREKKAQMNSIDRGVFLYNGEAKFYYV
jgi:hypothetical protein